MQEPPRPPALLPRAGAGAAALGSATRLGTVGVNGVVNRNAV
jgi:hypothetical protein